MSVVNPNEVSAAVLLGIGVVALLAYAHAAKKRRLGQLVTNPTDAGMGHGFMGWCADEPTKFYSAPAERNSRFILPLMRERLACSEAGGVVLECGSGSGQHIAALAQMLPQLAFQPTEYPGCPNPRAPPQSIGAILASIAAYCADYPNVRTPCALDASDANAWSAVAPLDSCLQAIIAINVIHISPPSVLAGILRAAGTKLRRGAFLFFYGAFARDGCVSDADLPFHQMLQAKDPSFGLRDISAIRTAAAAHGLSLADELYHEASNNFLLCFMKE